MNVKERSAYDEYPSWIEALAKLSEAIVNIPLDELVNAHSRMVLVGARIGPNETEPTDPVAMARQLRLIEAARTFRDAVKRPEDDDA